MQYHAVSLAEAGGEVDLIGFEGAAPIAAVSANPRIHVHQLADRAVSARARGGTGRFVIASMFRAARQAAPLVARVDASAEAGHDSRAEPAGGADARRGVAGRETARRPSRDRLAQPVAHASRRFSLGERHRAVRALARSERRWARRAGAHLAVSQAMADWLQREYRVRATVVYDRPPQAFSRSAGCGCSRAVGEGRARRSDSGPIESRWSCVRPAGRPTKIST